MALAQARIQVRATMAVDGADKLSRIYTPGVADDVRAIADHPERAAEHTTAGNAVAVVSDGSAVLGLGDVGPLAALPVLEGKAALFQRFAGLDAWPLCLRARDVEDIVRTVADVATGFAAVNLEDVAAPRCFQLERRLQQELSVPVVHDDQHGTAIVVLAALRNALRLVGRDLGEVRVVVADAVADRIPADRLSADHIVPSVFDRGLVTAVATAVREAADRPHRNREEGATS